MGTEFQFGKVEKIWRWMVEMVAPKYECTHCRQTVPIKIAKMVNFVMDILSPLKTNK